MEETEIAEDHPREGASLYLDGVARMMSTPKGVQAMTCYDCGMVIEAPDYKPTPGDVPLCKECFEKSPFAGIPHSTQREFTGKVVRKAVT